MLTIIIRSSFMSASMFATGIRVSLFLSSAISRTQTGGLLVRWRILNCLHSKGRNSRMTLSLTVSHARERSSSRCMFLLSSLHLSLFHSLSLPLYISYSHWLSNYISHLSMYRTQCLSKFNARPEEIYNQIKWSKFKLVIWHCSKPFPWTLGLP